MAPSNSHATSPLVRFEGVSKRFGATAAVDGVSLDIRAGEFFALLGPSGCGKTTLLRLLAGFERLDEGRVLLAGEDITSVPPHRRPVNMMFQSYALFPHLTVEGNIAFGLQQDGVARDEIAARVAEMLALVRLDGFGPRKPDQLSGGQRQRVALARSLVKRPRVLLLDEPLAALDKKLRDETRFELSQLQRRLDMTFMMVTHDQDEAMALADRIAVMNYGKLVQVGTPAEVYEQPNGRWIAEFVGDVTLTEGRIGENMAVEAAGGLRLHVAGLAGAAKGDAVTVALRPEKIKLAATRPEKGENAASGTVSDIGYFGARSLYKVKLDSGQVMKAAVAHSTGAAPIGLNDKVWLSWSADAGVVLRN